MSGYNKIGFHLNFILIYRWMVVALRLSRITIVNNLVKEQMYSTTQGKLVNYNVWKLFITLRSIVSKDINMYLSMLLLSYLLLYVLSYVLLLLSYITYCYYYVKLLKFEYHDYLQQLCSFTNKLRYQIF